MLNSFLDIFTPKPKTPLKLRFVNGCSSTCKGLVGLETPYSDVSGKRIHVGDLVDVYDKSTNKVTWTNFVCYSKNKSDNKIFGEYIFAIMGMYPTMENGGEFIPSDKYVRISKSHKTLVHGDRHDLIHAIEINDEIHPETAYNRVEAERPVIQKFHMISDEYLKLEIWGKPTGWTDCFGITLYTGDRVAVYDKENNYLGEYLVGKIPNPDENSQAFKLGLTKTKLLGFVNSSSHYHPNFHCRDHRMERVKTFEQACHGEIISGYRCVSA